MVPKPTAAFSLRDFELSQTIEFEPNPNSVLAANERGHLRDGLSDTGKRRGGEKLISSRLLRLDRNRE